MLRVCYVFGETVDYPIHTVTNTSLTTGITKILRNADNVATNILFGKTADGKGLLTDPATPNSSKMVQQVVTSCSTRTVFIQMPVVMIPVHFDRNPEVYPNSYQWSFVLRPFITSDFMTGIAALPGQHLSTEVSLLTIGSDRFFIQTVELMASEIKRTNLRCSRVLYDLTSKPPGTTEWE